MPALFAYLISLSVFLGGAYAGLSWLVNPPFEKALPRNATATHKQAAPPAEARLASQSSTAASAFTGEGKAEPVPPVTTIPVVAPAPRSDADHAAQPVASAGKSSELASKPSRSDK